MGQVQSVNANPNLDRALTDQSQPLGTEAFDIFSALLGLQGNGLRDWWQTGFQDPETSPDSKNPEGGADALLMGMGMPTPGAPGVPVPFDPAAIGLQGGEGTGPNAIQLGAASKASIEPQALESLPASVEGLDTNQMKSLVDSIWKDATSVKTEALPDTSHADATSHGILKWMALQAGEGTGVGVNDENAGKAAELVDKKALSSGSDGSSPWGVLVNQTTGNLTEVAKTQAQPSVSAAPADLMPQVYPKVESLIQQGGGKVTVALDPPELGKLTIEVTTRGRHVELAIRSDNEHARAALEGSLADLKQSLMAQNLHLTRADVQTAHDTSFASWQFGHQGQGGHSDPGSDFRQSRSAFFEQDRGFSQSLGRAPLEHRKTSQLDVRV